jgi:thioredoxin-like negative regulator of GroEL
MLTVLRRDKRYRDGEARLVSLGLLELLDDVDPQKREYLNKLASALF